MIMNGTVSSSIAAANNIFSSWYVTLVDVCTFGLMGLQAGLSECTHAGLSGVKCFSSLDGLDSAIVPTHDMSKGPHPTGYCLVVRLPDVPQDAMAILLSLGSMPLNIYTHVVVLSYVEPDIVRRFLLGGGVNRPVRILDSRLPITALCRAIVPPTSLEPLPLTWFGEVFLPRLTSLFTPGEMRALWSVQKAIPMYKQVIRTGVSNKTLYNQRNTALRKLGVRSVNDLIRILLSKRIYLRDEGVEVHAHGNVR